MQELWPYSVQKRACALPPYIFASFIAGSEREQQNELASSCIVTTRASMSISQIENLITMNATQLVATRSSISITQIKNSRTIEVDRFRTNHINMTEKM